MTSEISKEDFQKRVVLYRASVLGGQIGQARALKQSEDISAEKLLELNEQEKGATHQIEELTILAVMLSIAEPEEIQEAAGKSLELKLGFYEQNLQFIETLKGELSSQDKENQEINSK